MIHKACMPVYMNSGKIVADGRVDGESKVLQEVLADLKIPGSGSGSGTRWALSAISHPAPPHPAHQQPALGKW